MNIVVNQVIPYNQPTQHSLRVSLFKVKRGVFVVHFGYARLELNQRPVAYKATALTNLSYERGVVFLSKIKQGIIRYP